MRQLRSGTSRPGGAFRVGPAVGRLMRRWRPVAPVAPLVALALALAAGAQASVQSPPDAAPLPYIVTFAPGVSAAEQAAALEAAGATDLSSIAALRMHA